jgi:hypothetical protein
MIKPDDMKVGTWYISGNIMLYPYKRNEEQTVYHYDRNFYGDTFSMLTYQTITHFGPKRVEIGDTDQWEIRVDEKWKKSNVDPTEYMRNYLYLDEKEHVISDEDIEIPNADDFKRLVHAIFTYQFGWV